METFTVAEMLKEKGETEANIANIILEFCKKYKIEAHSINLSSTRVKGFIGRDEMVGNYYTYIFLK